MKSKKKGNSTRKKLKVFAAGCAVTAVIAALGVTAVKLLKEERRREEVVKVMVEEQNGKAVQNRAKRTITYKDKEYVYNRDIMNILFLGVDKTETVELQETPGTAGQADCIMLLSLNEADQTCEIMQISRDTITEIDVYDTAGNLYTKVQAPIATQYAYGNGEKSSCWAMNKTVSELLFDLPIDAYISLNINAISTLNDAVGGVKLSIPEDYTEIDPQFTKGAVLTLNGEQAEKYVRYRDTSVSGSNEGRMRRQVEYVTALLTAVRSEVGEEGSYFDRYSSYLKPYMVTDMDAKQIDTFAGYQFDPANTWYLPGELKFGEEHDEFHVNNDELHDILIKKFYKPEE